MPNYILISDSTTDITPEMAKELADEIIPLSYVIEGQEYKDKWSAKGSPGIKGFYNLIRDGKQPITSQINYQDFIEIFDDYLRGGKDVFYLAFSSGLSGTCAQAKKAAETLNERYNARRVLVVDTLAASMGEGLLLYYASKKYKSGVSMDELAEYVESIKMKMNHWVAVDDLFHLKRGGRLSAAAALMGSVLNIKPIIYMDYKGTLQPVKKVRGYKKALETLADYVSSANDPKDAIFISHSDCIESAEYLAKLIKEKYGNSDAVINYIGPVIGSHTGVGTVALFFIGKERTETQGAK